MALSLKHQPTVRSPSPGAAGEAATAAGGPPGGRPRRTRLVGAGLLALLAAGFGHPALQLGLGSVSGPGPGLWPFLVATALGVVAVLLAVTPSPSDETWEGFSGRSGRILLGVAALAAFVVAFEPLGFALPGVLLLLFWLRVFAGESWRTAVAVAVGVVAAIEVVFVHLIGVPFPADIFATLLMTAGG